MKGFFLQMAILGCPLTSDDTYKELQRCFQLTIDLIAQRIHIIISEREGEDFCSQLAIRQRIKKRKKAIASKIPHAEFHRSGKTEG
eukprot:c19420_g1_i2 orf=162-419(-)